MVSLVCLLSGCLGVEPEQADRRLYKTRNPKADRNLVALSLRSAVYHQLSI